MECPSSCPSRQNLARRPLTSMDVDQVPVNIYRQAALAIFRSLFSQNVNDSKLHNVRPWSTRIANRETGSHRAAQGGNPSARKEGIALTTRQHRCWLHGTGCRSRHRQGRRRHVSRLTGKLDRWEQRTDARTAHRKQSPLARVPARPLGQAGVLRGVFHSNRRQSRQSALLETRVGADVILPRRESADRATHRVPDFLSCGGSSSAAQPPLTTRSTTFQ
jgi:hypothetical protein